MRYLTDEIEQVEFVVPKYSKVEVLGNLVFVIMFGVVIAYFLIRYAEIDDSIAVQFDQYNGAPSSYAPKHLLLVFPIGLALVCGVLSVLESIPRRLKTSVRFDSRIAPILFSSLRKLLIYFKIVTCALFLFIISMTFRVILRESNQKVMYYSLIVLPFYLLGFVIYIQYMKKCCFFHKKTLS